MVHCRWRAVRSAIVQARITNDPAVLWTVLNAELMVCSRDPGRLQGCIWTTSDLRDGTEGFQADARADLRTLHPKLLQRVVQRRCKRAMQPVPEKEQVCLSLVSTEQEAPLAPTKS